MKQTLPVLATPEKNENEVNSLTEVTGTATKILYLFLRGKEYKNNSN